MKLLSDRQYEVFTPKERLGLTMAALARGDEPEANRLWATSPKYKYTCHDLEYTNRVGALIIISAMFFERVVYHYNLIQRADRHIMSSESCLMDEDEAELDDIACQTRSLIETIIGARKAHVAILRGTYEGFRLFCEDVGVNYHDILKTVPVERCCHDIQWLLDSEDPLNADHAQSVRDYFFDAWGGLNFRNDGSRG